MKKENILFAVVGLFIGFFGGFLLANNLNRNAVAQTDAAQSASPLRFKTRRRKPSILKNRRNKRR
jgi:D-alanyl-lipoteichoic acid acyltransferase DltB (MBOAT superfamily)